MSPTTLLLGLRLTGTIDRVEASTAVVEWADGDWSGLPVACASRIAEGRRLHVRLRPAASGSLAIGPHALLTPLGVVRLPQTLRLQPGSAYRVHLRTGGARPHRRPRPTDLPDVIDLTDGPLHLNPPPTITPKQT
jgi:hypothetical protein